MNQSQFFFGDWQVEPASNSLRNGDRVHQLEPKVMDVLLLLCREAGQVISAEDMLTRCWPGAEIGDNPVHKVIAQLRKVLGDDASNPQYIETIRKRGYRTVAPVVFPVGYDQAVAEGEWTQGSPFPGLRAFEPRDASVFFGRGEQITALLKSIASHIRDGRSLHIVLGPSGSGKTSLVNAGIIPNLLMEHGFDGIRALSTATVDMADVSESRLFLDLASALLDWEINDEPLFTGISAEVLAGELQTNLDKLVTLFSNAMQAQRAQHRYQLLLIDRLEALLSAPQFAEAARAQVVRIMDTFARSGAAIVIATCRNDFYPMLAQHKALMEGKSAGAHFDVLPPTRAELLQMIRLPAKAAQLSWESDNTDSLDQLLCDDAAESPDALPMLQYTLNELYQQRSDNELKLADYHALGGIEGAIGKRAEAIYLEQSDEVKAALPQIFAKLVSLSNDEKSITSRAALWSQLSSEHERQLVQVLVDHRLLVSHLVGDEPGFSLAHEALLRRWPRAVDWIHQHRYNIKIKSRLTLAAERWLSEKEAKEFLIPDGKPLFEAKEIQQNQLFALTELEQRYIGQSNKRSNVRKLIKRATIFSLALLTMLSVAMTLRSVESERRAEERRAQADDLLGFMVGEFADKVRPLGRLDLLGGVSEKALEYLSNVNEEMSASSKIQLAKALVVFGEVALTKGGAVEAEKAFRSAHNTLVSLDESVVSKGVNERAPNQSSIRGLVQRELGVTSYWLGTIAYNQGKYSDAKPHYLEYFNYSQRYSDMNPDNADGLMELSYAKTNLGTLALKEGYKSEAIKEFQTALTFSNRALLISPENRIWQASRIGTQSWLGSTLEAIGDFKGSMLSMENEILSLKKLIQDSPSEVKWQWSLANALQRKSNLLWKVGDHDSAINAQASAVDILRELIANDPENSEYQEQMLSSKVALSLWDFELNGLDVNNSSELLHKVKEFRNNTSSSLSIERLFLLAQLNQASALYFNSRYTQSIHQLEEFFVDLERAAIQSPNSIALKLIKGKGLLLVAKVLFSLDDPISAQRKCEEVVDLFRENASSLDGVEVQSLWVRAHYCLGKEELIVENSQWLSSIGYKEISYLRTLNVH